MVNRSACPLPNSSNVQITSRYGTASYATWHTQHGAPEETVNGDPQHRPLASPFAIRIRTIQRIPRSAVTEYSDRDYTRTLAPWIRPSISSGRPNLTAHILPTAPRYPPRPLLPWRPPKSPGRRRPISHRRRIRPPRGAPPSSRCRWSRIPTSPPPPSNPRRRSVIFLFNYCYYYRLVANLNYYYIFI